ncbi:hypothetical protein [Actomonas aquatica]|uniref:DUF4345 domain-containing protein n=1 Tax=Actomonas aquatica TaxID=2866162 RepID=A0ABZ1C2M4_9BACT|nr:hypothetical protein [Opitutus sp. WL0086]WRQ85961.1 hypothetical protein K1X11_014200 [Opitutus sp. WL0086]
MKNLIRNLCALPFAAPWGYTLMVYFCLLFSFMLLMALNPFATFRRDGVEITFREFWASGAGPFGALVGLSAGLCARGLIMRRQRSQWSGVWMGAVMAVGAAFSQAWQAVIVFLTVGFLTTIYLSTNRAVALYFAELNENDDDQSESEGR